MYTCLVNYCTCTDDQYIAVRVHIFSTLLYMYLHIYIQVGVSLDEFPTNINEVFCQGLLTLAQLFYQMSHSWRTKKKGHKKKAKGKQLLDLRFLLPWLLDCGVSATTEVQVMIHAESTHSQYLCSLVEFCVGCYGEGTGMEYVTGNVASRVCNISKYHLRLEI